MATCPCCSDPLLRHIRGHQTVWFCRHCWQIMPEFGIQPSQLTLSDPMPLEVTLHQLVMAGQHRALAPLNDMD